MKYVKRYQNLQYVGELDEEKKRLTYLEKNVPDKVMKNSLF